MRFALFLLLSSQAYEYAYADAGNSRALSWQGLRNAQLSEFVQSSDPNKTESLRGTLPDGGHLVVNLHRKGGEAQAKLMRDSHQLIVETAYKSYQSPYPGFISQRVQCGDINKPKALSLKTKESWLEGFKVFTNQRFALADCRVEDRVYRALWAVLRCKQTDLNFEIKLMLNKSTPEPKLDKIFKSFSCSP